MTIVKCIQDDVGYWLVGESYAAGYAGGGMLSLGDEEDPEADWIATPVTYGDDNTITYRIGGIDGVVEFIEENAH